MADDTSACCVMIISGIRRLFFCNHSSNSIPSPSGNRKSDRIISTSSLTIIRRAFEAVIAHVTCNRSRSSQFFKARASTTSSSTINIRLIPAPPSLVGRLAPPIVFRQQERSSRPLALPHPAYRHRIKVPETLSTEPQSATIPTGKADDG